MFNHSGSSKNVISKKIVGVVRLEFYVKGVRNEYPSNYRLRFGLLLVSLLPPSLTSFLLL